MHLARAVADDGLAQSQQPDPDNAWSSALSGLGIDQGSSSSVVCYLWPDNVLAWNCWQGVQTQWRVGHSGATGLDYAGVAAFLDEMGVRADERRGVFSGIRACERATLDAWSEQRARKH